MKSQIFSHISAIFVLVNICKLSVGVQEYPQIKILKWMSSGTYQWEYENITSDVVGVTDGYDDTIYTVAQHLFAIAITCNASYPVQWIFQHHDRMKTYSVRIKSYRQAENIYDVKSFKFSSVLIIYSDTSRVTGEYSCQKMGAEKIQNLIYIYWLASSPPYLIQAGKTITVKSQNSKTLILPCIVSSPDVSSQVTLYKQNETGEYSHVGPTQFKYDPKIGFGIPIKPNGSSYGHYKCSIDEDQDDFVLLIAVQGTDKRFKINNLMQGNSTFEYDKLNRQIKCCSTSAKPPNILKTYCSDPLTCQFREFSVMQGGNNGEKWRNSSCTSVRKYYRGSGVLRCKGDGIDIVRHFFSPLANAVESNETVNGVYFNWGDVDPLTLIEIKTNVHSFEEKIYANETFDISCDTSSYYFAQGLHLALKWRNGTIQFLNATSTYEEYYWGSDMEQSFKLVGHVDMVQAICFAPIWNSTLWVNKSFSFTVHHAIAPKLLEEGTKEVTWSVGQSHKSLACAIEGGQPLPVLHWTKDSRMLFDDKNTLIVNENGSTSVTFTKVFSDMHGEYKCVGSNVAGVAEKIFRIVVEVPSQTAWGTICGAILGVVGFVVVVGLFIWKMSLQKKIIHHLTTVLFRDAEREDQLA